VTGGAAWEDGKERRGIAQQRCPSDFFQSESQKNTEKTGGKEVERESGGWAGKGKKGGGFGGGMRQPKRGVRRRWKSRGPEEWTSHYRKCEKKRREGDKKGERDLCGPKKATFYTKRAFTRLKKIGAKG